MGTFSALGQLSVIAASTIANVQATTLSSPGPYHPRQWSTPATTMITVPSTSAPAGPTSVAIDPITQQPLPSAPAFQGTPAQVYVFDCVERVGHNRALRKTENPIQVSAASPVASVCDNAVLLPARVVLDIGMSDVMANYIAGSWTTNKSKSVSAFETLVTLMENRTLVTLTTRLATYTNMIVEGITADDTVETLHGLSASVVFGKINTATATAVSSTLITNGGTDASSGPAVSAIPSATDTTPLGTLQPTTPSAALTQQNNVTQATGATATTVSQIPAVPGAGTWSSTNTAQLGVLFA
jgi:hypothetical protein